MLTWYGNNLVNCSHTQIEIAVKKNIPIDDIKIQRTDGHSNQIKLDDNIMILYQN